MKLGIAIAATVAAQGKKTSFSTVKRDKKAYQIIFGYFGRSWVRQFFADRWQNTKNFRKFGIWEIIQNWDVNVDLGIEHFDLALELELDRWLENPP